MLRRISMLTIIALATLPLQSCGKKEQASGGGAKGDGKGGDMVLHLQWAQWTPSDSLQEMCDRFFKETGIKIEVGQTPWPDFEMKVDNELRKPDPAFDMVVGDSQWLGKGATYKHYMELTDWITGAVELDKYEPSVLNYLCQYPAGSGKYFAAPCMTDAMGFIYRKDWFEDAKNQADFKAKYGRDLTPPNTWTEFNDVAEFFTRPNANPPIYGASMLTGQGYDELTMGLQQVIWMFGGSYGDPKTFKVKGYLDTPGAIEGLQFYIDTLKYCPAGATNTDYPKAIENFLNGTVAMSMAYFSFFPDAVTKMGDKAGIFMIPGKDNGGKITRIVSLGGQGISILSKTPPDRVEACKKFIAWFCSPEAQKQCSELPGGFSASKEVLSDPAFQARTPYNKPLADSVPLLQDFWSLPIYSDLLLATQEEWVKAIEGKQTAAQAMKNLAERHEALFKQAKDDGLI